MSCLHLASASHKSLYGLETGRCTPRFLFTHTGECINGVVKRGVLTRDGAKVEVVPNDLLELVIQ